MSEYTPTYMIFGYLLLCLVAIGLIMLTYYMLQCVIAFVSWIWYDIIKKRWTE